MGRVMVVKIATGLALATALAGCEWMGQLPDEGTRQAPMFPLSLEDGGNGGPYGGRHAWRPGSEPMRDFEDGLQDAWGGGVSGAASGRGETVAQSTASQRPETGSAGGSGSGSAAQTSQAPAGGAPEAPAGGSGSGQTGDSRQAGGSAPSAGSEPAAGTGTAPAGGSTPPSGGGTREFTGKPDGVTGKPQNPGPPPSTGKPGGTGKPDKPGKP